MDESKRPSGFVPEPDLQGLQPLPDEVDRSNKYNASRPRRFSRKTADGREDRVDKGRGLVSENSYAHYSGRTRQGPVNRRRFL